MPPRLLNSESSGPIDRVISLGEGLPSIPERLLLAHSKGKVLFITGAGISVPAKLPDFRELTLKVYEKLDGAVYSVIRNYAHGKPAPKGLSALTHQQAAEVKRYMERDYDVVLGLLERRMDRQPGSRSKVRQAIADELRLAGAKPAAIHRALMRLADRGGAITMVTTNFDLLLQEAVAKNVRPKPLTYALGGIPRPGMGLDFSGVLHIHGALELNPDRASDLVVTDQDFGEFYLRRRTVPDFIYDAARLFHIVLVGYSANDPPMRYLLNAVAADGVRFDDLKERFTFVGVDKPDPVAMEDWKGRGITPISYDSKNGHESLLLVLKRWAELSAINGSAKLIDAEIKRIVKKTRSKASDSDCDLFEHLIRRSDNSERIRLSRLASMHGADIGWLDAIVAVGSEKSREVLL